MYLALKWLHLVSSTVLLGTGAGIAFFFARAQRSGDVRVIAAVGKEVVLADFLFTAMAVLLQPITGFALIHISGIPWNQGWLLLSIFLYVVVGVCWLPVVWLQIRMRDIAIAAATAGTELPAIYSTYYRLWYALGWPAFGGVLAIFYLMTARPALWTG
jgi:uncharacterized membrane protein